jgi:hypothetical protein
MNIEVVAPNTQQQKPIFLKAEALLPHPICKRLSHQARRLYAAAWNQAHRLGVGAIWIRESDFGRFAGLDQDGVNSAKSELVAARLIKWEHGLTQTRFEFTDPDADEFAAIFREPTEE